LNIVNIVFLYTGTIKKRISSMTQNIAGHSDQPGEVNRYTASDFVSQLKKTATHDGHVLRSYKVLSIFSKTSH
jgi:hypothetical protein